MKIKGNKVQFEYTITPETYWLYCEAGDSKDEGSGFWWLAQKIDRSYKGKVPDIAVPDVQITYKQMQELHKKFGLDKVWE